MLYWDDMMTKKAFILSTILFMGALGIYLLLSSGIQPPRADVQDTVADTESTDPIVPTVREETLEGSNELYLVRGTYPQFEGAPSAFNEEIKTYLETVWKEFQDMTKENWQATIETALPGDNIGPMPEAPFEFIVEYSLGELSTRYVSVMFHYGGYAAGGAHGYADFATFTYDLENGKDVTLADVFSNDPDYLTTISTYVRADLIEQFEKMYAESGIEGPVDTGWIEEGTKPEVEFFKNFTIQADDTIRFYFPSYQVAAYAAGEQMVTMPISSNTQ